jgi:hypothetical protein
MNIWKRQKTTPNNTERRNEQNTPEQHEQHSFQNDTTEQNTLNRPQSTTIDSNTPSQRKEKQYMQIRLHTDTTTNLPFGDNILDSPEDGTIILNHNINGIKDQTNWYQIMNTMKELNVDIFGFTEINKSINYGYNNEWRAITRKLFYHERTAHSESNIELESSYKPGGTMTTITGKWQSRISAQGQDPKGLGQWSYIKISSKKTSMIIVTAYRPCATQGPQTAWMQQWAMLRETGEKNPDPIKHFYRDLETQLQEWKNQGSHILLMIDANEHVGEKPDGMTSIIGRIGMTDLIRHLHPNTPEPNTHIQGSR